MASTERRSRHAAGPLAVVAVVVLLAAVAGCGSPGHRTTSPSTASTPSTAPGGPAVHLDHAVLRVPGRYPTVPAALRAARPGDLILVSPGVYPGGIAVDVPDVVVRGTDRNTVVFDGGNTVPNGFTVSADGVAIENLTVRHFAVNGVLFTKAGYAGAGSGQDGAASAGAAVLVGFRASYLTTYDNGLYGVYSFVARNGLIDHVTATGQPDSGIYVGQCKPCDVVVRHDTASGNRVGFEAANASGGLVVVDSDFSANRSGVAVESSTQELLAPQDGAVVAGNLVSDNNNPRTPTEDEETDVFGYGIAIGGGTHDVVQDNRVTANASVGVVVTTLAGYPSGADVVRGNVVTGNGTDLVDQPTAAGSGSSAGTCFTANRYRTSVPTSVETVLTCGGPTRSVDGAAFHPHTGPPGSDYETLPGPGPQAGLPDAASAPAAPATDLPPAVDLAAVRVPAA